MILDFLDIFREKPGRAKGTVHSIRTPEGCVIRDYWRQVPQHFWKTVKQEITWKLELDTVEESRSPWKSPVVVEPEPDGTIRVSVGFRKVNEVAAFDAFPMPQVEEMLEKTSQAKYISTLDLMKGYWQIPMNTVDKDKTAFGTPWGLFQFKCMPFGLHGTAVSFQSSMDKALSPHQDYAPAYIDDIIIFSSSWE